MDTAKSDNIDGTGRPPRQVSVATLIIGAVVLAALIRGMSAVMTQFLAWPLFGVLPTALYPSQGFRIAVAFDLFLSAVAVAAGLLVGFKARRDPELWWRGIQRTGRILMIDVGVYMLSLLVAIAALAEGAGTAGLWLLLVYIAAGNAVLFWLGLRISRAGRSLRPPPPEED